MPENLKVSQIGSSPLPPPFRGLHSPGVRKLCQIIFACYFRKSSICPRARETKFFLFKSFFHSFFLFLSSFSDLYFVLCTRSLTPHKWATGSELIQHNAALKPGHKKMLRLNDIKNSKCHPKMNKNGDESNKAMISDTKIVKYTSHKTFCWKIYLRILEMTESTSACTWHGNNRVYNLTLSKCMLVKPSFGVFTRILSCTGFQPESRLCHLKAHDTV